MSTDRQPETVTELVEAQVRRTPEAPAVVAGATILTYAELDRRADGLARRLQALGVGPDVPVAVLTGRSPEMTVGLLAILKAGGACLPIDPSVPDERVRVILEDSGAPVILTEARLVERLGAPGAWIVLVDEAGDAPEAGVVPVDEAGDAPEAGVVLVDEAGDAPDGGGAAGAGGEAARARGTTPDDVAYIIYTSGSTGAPKGVLLSHRGLVNHHRAVADLYRLAPGDRVLQFCSMSFDVSVEEIFPTWASGATVVLRDDSVPILGRSWLEWLRRQRITLLNLPTAYWHEWVRDLHSRGETVPETVRLVTVGGEKALGRAYRMWLQVGGRRVRWINAYGPTEATIMATWFEPDPTASQPPSWEDPPIGRPLAGTTAYVVDDAGHRVVDGATGELYLGGAGVARGYLDRPQLTAERFVPDPFGDGVEGRLYRSGDQVRMRPDGDLEFAGRLDQQVKVRGFRIECGEVEAALLAHPGVADAVVIGREDTPGARRLVGYVLVDEPAAITGHELRRFLSERLPPYMIPTAFVVLDAFPTTPNGKVDRQGLPAPARSQAGVGAVPATPTEEVLAAIWSQVLGIEGLAVDEDFFDLGGQSLLATQVVAQVRETFGIDLPVHALFESPSVRALAVTLERQGAEGSAVPPLVALVRTPGEPVALSLPQEQMWGLELDASPPGLYNITALHRFSHPVDPALLELTLAYLSDRHDALRTAFVSQGEAIFQTVAATAAPELTVTDLRAASDGDQEQEFLRLVGRQDAEPFELGRAPLARAGLFVLGDDVSVLAVTFDHLISDGTSAYILLSELAETYAALAREEAPALAPLRVQYPDFAVWQRRWLTEERQRGQLEYWRKALVAMPSGPALAFDRVPSAPSRRIASRVLAVPPELYRDLNRLAREAHATMFVVAVAAVDVALHAAGGRQDIVLSTTLSGRQRAEVDGVIGYFANIGRIRTDLTGDPTFAEVVERAKESVFGMFEHQDIPFIRVREALFPAFPSGGGVHPLAVLPVELQYFHAGQDGWAPGLGVVERPGTDKGPDELFFRGQLHPLSVSLLDDGSQWWGEVNYKLDFYDEATIERLASGILGVLEAVALDPHRRLSDLVAVVVAGGDGAPDADNRPGTRHRNVGTWRLEASQP